MKLTIIGAGGLRTPLLLRSINARQESLEIHELALMDIDEHRLDLIFALNSGIENTADIKFRITKTIDPIVALQNADYVITTFRVGGIESRAIDERVPLMYGVLGQETTGAGGFAMGLRSIPIILNYIKMMQQVCPEAWLINFANPAGMLAEAVIRYSSWKKVVGICDGPASLQRAIASSLLINPEDLFIEYFGLNHLGWVRSAVYQNNDLLPDLINRVRSSDHFPGLPFDGSVITSLGLIPNEYLYYFYYSKQAVNNIISAGESRGEQITRLNTQLFERLSQKYEYNDNKGMVADYQTYLNIRGGTYMATETGRLHPVEEQKEIPTQIEKDEGYAGVALNLIEALSGKSSIVQILNVINHGSISCMGQTDVVEIPCRISKNLIQPFPIGDIPEHCQGLMKQIKNYEHLTIAAAIERSYQKALLALTIHPLISDFNIAKNILDEYIVQHHDYFPILK